MDNALSKPGLSIGSFGRFSSVIVGNMEKDVVFTLRGDFGGRGFASGRFGGSLDGAVAVGEGGIGSIGADVAAESQGLMVVWDALAC